MHGFALNDIFKIGIGPSSSHTMGPMYAAQHFLSQLEARAEPGPFRVQVTLHGSLAATGDGHGTPGAITAGLMGYHYETVTLPDIEAAWTKSKWLFSRRQLIANRQSSPPYVGLQLQIQKQYSVDPHLA